MFNFRRIFFLLFLVTALILGFSYYAEFVLHYPPCLLCLLQRFIFFALCFVFFLGSLHRDTKVSRSLYCVINLILLILGLLIASRQVWLQHLPSHQVTTCLPGAMYLIKHVPLKELLNMIYSGTAECAKVHWRFIGFSMAEWALIWYAGFIVILLWLWCGKKR